MALTLPGWVAGHYTADELARGARSIVDTGATLGAGGLYPSAFITTVAAGDYILYLQSDPATAKTVYLTPGVREPYHAVKAKTSAGVDLADGVLAFCYVR